MRRPEKKTDWLKLRKVLRELRVFVYMWREGVTKQS